MNLVAIQTDPAAFRQCLLIDTDNGPRPLGQCVDDWQDRDFKALDSGWLRAVQGAKTKATYSRAWLERGRGHSKTQDLAIDCTWALVASRRRLSGYGCAADKDQARLLRDSIGRLVFINPWLSKLIEVESYRVVNQRTGSTLEILSSDAPTSYGLLGDFFVCDELCNWAKRDLWDSIFSSAAKRSTAMLVIISNAGMTDDWTWQLREAVRQDPKWYFSRLEGPTASWISPEMLDEQRRLLPSIAFQRLWENVWTSGGGDALTPEVIDRAFRSDLRPMTEAAPGSVWQFVAGIDLGVSRDASAVCVLAARKGVAGKGMIRLAHTRLWRPTKHSKVNLSEVERALIDLHRTFRLQQINFDPWQAIHLAQRLQALDLGRMASGYRSFTPAGQGRKASLPVVEIASTQKNLQAMATSCIESFNDGRVELYENADLRRDLRRMRVEERPQGFRLTFPRDSLGHGDLGTAFLLALLAASEFAGKRIVKAGAILTNPLQLAERRAQRRAEEYKRLDRPEDHQAPWRAAMARCGRVGLPALQKESDPDDLSDLLDLT